ncbi:hypothetical protein [Niabella hibiscisoli]|uniref:hypothetical protein n=1 Tax=Niabella hibiscisoli TaxID=1825928 RepID=UPI001F0EC5A8|nr:hypothetical protein [Niabella hibiscisoli]MCH5720072.1 hypothetical protein [Niabella hibiscisoli]
MDGARQSVYRSATRSENNPGASTWAPVTTPLIVWDGKIILPQGEARPGVRTNRVLVASPQ